MAGYGSGLNGLGRCRCPDMRFSPNASATLPLPSEIVAVAAADCHLTPPAVGTAATRAETASHRAQKARSSAAHIAGY